MSTVADLKELVDKFKRFIVGKETFVGIASIFDQLAQDVIRDLMRERPADLLILAYEVSGATVLTGEAQTSFGKLKSWLLEKGVRLDT